MLSLPALLSWKPVFAPFLLTLGDSSLVLFVPVGEKEKRKTRTKAAAAASQLDNVPPRSHVVVPSLQHIMSKDTKDPEKAMDVVDSDHEDVEEDDDDVAGGDPAAQAKAALLQNPALLSALQGKLNGMVGTSSGYIQVDSSTCLTLLN